MSALEKPQFILNFFKGAEKVLLKLFIMTLEDTIFYKNNLKDADFIILLA